MKHVKWSRLVCAIGMCALLWPTSPAHAQGVTTGAIAGIVKDPSGQVVPGATVTALHEPSGTNYEAFTRADGRFVIPGMRVGGPYKISASLTGFTTETKGNVDVSLGVSTDLDFTLKLANIAETITVIGVSDPVFSSTRTGAATSVNRSELATLPTISGRINDITRLSPQYGGSGTFSGQDNRANNITVDGSYFNNSFGLGGQPGDRTGVAPISLEAIEQVQVNVAPYDVRQGNFVGAGVNTVTRSGTNRLTASVYRRMRNESFVGKEAAGLAFNPGIFTTYNTGVWAGGPIVKNRLFAFGSFEKQDDSRPLTTFRSNPGGAPVGGNTTRVLASDLTNLSSFLSTNFKYDTGPFDGITKLTPGKPFLVKGDYNINNANKVTFRYNQLRSSTDVGQSGSGSLGVGRGTFSTNFLSFKNSNYTILENIKSGIGEWNWVIGSNKSNSFISGYTHQNEDRAQIGLFPFVTIFDSPGGVAYTSFGSEPFTPFNLLRYNTFQAQDNFTWFSRNHSITMGGSVEKYHSDNSFYFGVQSAYTYNSLADFYADANGFLANPNRTVAPIPLRRFEVKNSLVPGETIPPIQPLDVVYSSGYIQDEWRPKTNVTVTAGVRMDVAKFGNTAFPNANADALTFRDETGAAVRYSTGKLPDANPLWSPRLGFNWDVAKNQQTQVRGGTGVFTGKPPYVWISNQIGNTGALAGFIQTDNTTAYPFNPNPDKYKPTATGALATSYELDVTDPNFKFPQTWRTNIALDRRLWWGLVGTGEFIYNRDLNSPLYINANLPPAQSAFTGADNRPRWVATPVFPACAAAGQVGPCVTRLNNATGNQVTNAFVIKNTDKNRSWNVAVSLAKPMTAGFSFKGAYSYGVSRGVVEPGSTVSSTFAFNPIVMGPNNAPLAYSTNSPGHRGFVAASYSRQYFGFGATTVSVFWDTHTNGNTSYVFAGDPNGDTFSGNDLIYIPRDTSEMNFVTFTAAGRAFTAADQAAAFEQYIQRDKYLSSHRGQYAERGAVFLPLVTRADLSLSQGIFHSIRGRRHSGQIRLDITNFGNLLNHDWGVGQRIVNNQILTTGAADATGKLSYRMQLLNNNLITSPLQTTAGIADVYVMMLSFRYTFQ